MFMVRPLEVLSDQVVKLLERSSSMPCSNCDLLTQQLDDIFSRLTCLESPTAPGSCVPVKDAELIELSEEFVPHRHKAKDSGFAQSLVAATIVAQGGGTTIRA